MYMNIISVNMNSIAWKTTRHFCKFRLFAKNLHYSKHSSLSQLCVLRLFTTTPCAKGIKFPRRENMTFLQILHAKPECKDTLIPHEVTTTEQPISVEEWSTLLESKWEEATPEAVADAFHRATLYAATYNIQISDDRLDPLCLALKDKCSALDDDRLLRCLRDLSAWPETASFREHNFAELWMAFDRALASRGGKWSLPQLLLATDHWNALSLIRHSRFSTMALRRLFRKPSRLPTPHLVQALFYANCHRKPTEIASMIDVEYDLERRLNELSLEDLSVVAAAFFKGKTKIRNERLLSHMMEKMMKETSSIRDVQLASLAKVLRYSAPISLVQQFYALLGGLQEEVPRLSMMSCTHLAVAGANLQVLHEGLLRKVVERTMAQATEVRIKDLERIAMAVSLFNFPIPSQDAATDLPCTFEVTVERELRRRLGSLELQGHPKCLPRTLYFLSQRQVFPMDLIAATLNPDYLKEAYGQPGHAYDQELLGLDVAVGLECPEYNGPRLTPKDRAIVAKKFRHRLPVINEERGSHADRFNVQLLTAAATVIGSADRVTVRHLLPQVSLADVVLRLSCKELEEKRTQLHFLPLLESFLVAPPSGEPRQAPVSSNKEERWVALVAGSRNCFVDGDGGGVHLSGFTSVHLRHLSLLGYTPVLVPWFEWNSSTVANRCDYLRELLQRAAVVPAGTVIAPSLGPRPSVNAQDSQATQAQ